MTQTPGSNLAHSVRARLKNAAAEGGRPFVEVLELYAIERFLHRLGRSRQRDRFVLKGAMLLRAPPWPLEEIGDDSRAIGGEIVRLPELTRTDGVPECRLPHGEADVFLCSMSALASNCRHQ